MESHFTSSCLFFCFLSSELFPFPSSLFFPPFLTSLSLSFYFCLHLYIPIFLFSFPFIFPTVASLLCLSFLPSFASLSCYFFPLTILSLSSFSLFRIFQSIERSGRVLQTGGDAGCLSAVITRCSGLFGRNDMFKHFFSCVPSFATTLLNFVSFSYFSSVTVEAAPLNYSETIKSRSC